MKKAKGILKALPYICLSCVIVLGLMTIVGTGGDGEDGSSIDISATADSDGSDTDISDDGNGTEPELTVNTYLTSTDIISETESESASFTAQANYPKGSYSDGSYITTPIWFGGKLLRVNFHSDSTIDPDDNYFPPDTWFLRRPEGSSEAESYANGGTVPFDLRRTYEVTGSLVGVPEKTGYGIYRSLFLEYTYVDVAFRFIDKLYAVRVCTSDWDGCIRGDLMMRDDDGTYKWISQSGDPDTLLANRPEDPVIRSDIAEWASGWAVGDDTATIFCTVAHIPETYYFDVPSTTGRYWILLNFDLRDVIILQGIDPSNYTKKDILEKWQVGTFIGKGDPDNHLKVIPRVVYQPVSGVELYSVTCKRCHGDAGSGGDIGPNIQGKTIDNVDQAIENVAEMQLQDDLNALLSAERQTIADYLSEVE